MWIPRSASSNVLKALSTLFQLFPGLMRRFPRLIYRLTGGFLCSLGRLVNFLLRLIFQVAHRVNPLLFLIVQCRRALCHSAIRCVADVLHAILYRIVRLFGQTFVPTTEALIQNASTSGASGVSANSVGIRRPIVLGAEVLIEGDFEGMEQFLNREGMSPIGSAFMVDGVVQIMTPPLDALQQWAKLAWDWIGGFAVPTDLTATPSIIASASSSLFKRACIIETSA